MKTRLFCRQRLLPAIPARVRHALQRADWWFRIFWMTWRAGSG